MSIACCVSLDLRLARITFANSPNRHYNQRTFHLELMDLETPPPAPPQNFL